MLDIDEFVSKSKMSTYMEGTINLLIYKLD